MNEQQTAIQNLNAESIAYIDDNDCQVMQDNSEPYLNVYIVLTDNALEALAKETGLLEKTGCSDLDELSGTDYQLNTYADIDENNNVSLVISLTSAEEVVLKNLPKEFSDAVIEQTEVLLEKDNSSIQQAFADYREYEREEPKTEA